MKHFITTAKQEMEGKPEFAKPMFEALAAEIKQELHSASCYLSEIESKIERLSPMPSDNAINDTCAEANGEGFRGELTDILTYTQRQNARLRTIFERMSILI